jgi:hypothetical protein
VLFDLGPAVLNGVEVVGVGGQKDQTDVILKEHLFSDLLGGALPTEVGINGALAKFVGEGGGYPHPL